MDISTALIFLGLGFVIGIFSGLISIGGGLLLIPTMLYLFPGWTGLHFPLKIITGMAVTQGVAGSFSSTVVHARNQHLEPQKIFMLGFGSMLGSYLGGFTSQFYEDLWIHWLLAALLLGMMVLSIYSPRPAANEDSEEESTGKGFNWPFFSVTVVVGYVSGILGIGGAAFIVPLMYSLMRIPVRRAIALGAGIVFLTSLASFVGKLQAGQILFAESGLIAIGAIFGGIVGAKISAKCPLPVLKAMYFLLTSLSLIRTVWGIFENQPI